MVLQEIVGMRCLIEGQLSSQSKVTQHLEAMHQSDAEAFIYESDDLSDIPSMTERVRLASLLEHLASPTLLYPAERLAQAVDLIMNHEIALSFETLLRLACTCDRW